MEGTATAFTLFYMQGRDNVGGGVSEQEGNSGQGNSTISKFDMGISDAPSLVSAEEGFSQTSHPTQPSAQETVIPEIWLHILRTSIFGIIIISHAISRP